MDSIFLQNLIALIPAIIVGVTTRRGDYGVIAFIIFYIALMY